MMRDTDDAGTGAAGVDRVADILSAIGSADFERFDPPGVLWGRIAASIAAEPDSTPIGSGTVVEYSIDANDMVVTVDEDWASFARENDAVELAETAPDRTLWSYFDGDEVSDLWRLIIEQVRAKQTRAQVPLRCDAPHTRRWFEMTVTPEPDNVVHFRSVLVFEEQRSGVALLELSTERNDAAPTVPVCSWCGDGHDGSQWLQIEALVRDLRLLEDRLPSISYGVCPTCRNRMSADLLVLARSNDSPS